MNEYTKNPTSSLLQSIQIPDKKAVFFGGKGGVGKTTCAVLAALSLCEHHRVLLISTDPAHSLSDSLCIEHESSTHKVSGFPNLTIWEIDANDLYTQFKAKHKEELKHLLDTTNYYDQEDVHQLLDLPLPGVDEIMGLKAVADACASDLYDKVIIDTAPTGHALRLLMMPDTLDHWIKTMSQMRWKYRVVQKTFKGKYTKDDADDLLLSLKRDVVHIRKLLTDPIKSEFVVVLKPEKMVIEETLRMCARLQENQVMVRHLIVNGIMTDTASPFTYEIHKRQKELLKNYQSRLQPYTMLSLPAMPYDVSGIDQLLHMKTYFEK